MSDIQFDEPGLDYARQYARQAPKHSAISGMIIRAGFAKNEQQASIVMIVIAIVASIIGYMFWPSSSLPVVPDDTMQQQNDL